MATTTAAKKKASSKKAAPKKDVRNVIEVDVTTARSDEDALVGHFVEVTAGDHEGRHGVLEGVSNPDKDGYPQDASVRTRDAQNILIGVKYRDLKRASSGRRVE
jgi:hypothetical protein